MTKENINQSGTSKQYVKSPLNYVGGKYKLLPQIIPRFPTNIDTFVDLFGGGFNVGINVNANTVIYNDINLKVVQILEYLNNTDIDTCLSQIDNYIKIYDLSKTNKEGYIKLRSDYNANPNPIMLYTLICYAFNNQIRFNEFADAWYIDYRKYHDLFVPDNKKNCIAVSISE